MKISFSLRQFNGRIQSSFKQILNKFHSPSNPISSDLWFVVWENQIRNSAKKNAADKNNFQLFLNINISLFQSLRKTIAFYFSVSGSGNNIQPNNCILYKMNRSRKLVDAGLPFNFTSLLIQFFYITFFLFLWLKLSFTH